MKHKTTLLAALTVFQATASVYAAASVSYSTYTATSSSDTSWISPPSAGTEVAAFNVGSGTDTLYGGVDWIGANVSQTSGGISFNYYKPGTWAPQASVFYSGTDLLNSGAYWAYNTEAQVHLDGFTVGQKYMLQFVFADTRYDGGTLSLQGTTGVTGDSADTTYSYTDGRYLVVNAQFTADTANTTWTPNVSGGQGEQINAIRAVAAETNVTWNNNASNMIWSSSAGNWSVGPGWQYATNNAVFGATGAGTVNLADETIGVHNITFDAAGYTISGNTLILDNSTITTNADAAISSVLAGSTGLTKTGSGILTLSSTNTYTGATNVNAGKLVINGSTAAGSAVTVASGATLGGSGTVGGATTIQSGGHLAVGDSPGTQTFSGSLTFDSGSIFDWELNAATSDPGASSANAGAYDKVVANGAVSGTSVLTIALGTNAFTDAFWDTNKSWNDIFTGTGSFNLANIFTTFGGTGVATNGVVSGQGQFSFTSNTLNWTAVPEPTSALAGLLLTVGLLRRRR